MLVGLGCLTSGGDAHASPATRSAGTGACRFEVIEGEVKAAESFTRPIGNGLEIRLEALSWASGWALRVLPIHGPRPAHDYIELATPPYTSVSPLLLSTDYSFRAQDAVAWNPRRFRFIASATDFANIAAVYERYNKTTPPAPDAANELATLVSKAPEGSLQILDARLIPGTANQAQTAIGVASHFNTTAHTVEEAAGGQGTALGKLMWIRFRIRLELPSGFRADPAATVTKDKCS